MQLHIYLTLHCANLSTSTRENALCTFKLMSIRRNFNIVIDGYISATQYFNQSNLWTAASYDYFKM